MGPAGILGEEVGRNPKTQALTKTAEGLVLRFLSLVSFVAAQQACCVRYLLVAPPSSSATMVLTLRFSYSPFVPFRFLDYKDSGVRFESLSVWCLGFVLCVV